MLGKFGVLSSDCSEATGIKVLACENTMRNLKVSKDDIAPSVGYVPAGVAHIMRRQKEDWDTLRP